MAMEHSAGISMSAEKITLANFIAASVRERNICGVTVADALKCVGNLFPYTGRTQRLIDVADKVALYADDVIARRPACREVDVFGVDIDIAGRRAKAAARRRSQTQGLAVMAAEAG